MKKNILSFFIIIILVATNLTIVKAQLPVPYVRCGDRLNCEGGCNEDGYVGQCTIVNAFGRNLCICQEPTPTPTPTPIPCNQLFTICDGGSCPDGQTCTLNPQDESCSCVTPTPIPMLRACVWSSDCGVCEICDPREGVTQNKCILGTNFIVNNPNPLDPYQDAKNQVQVEIIVAQQQNLQNIVNALQAKLQQMQTCATHAKRTTQKEHIAHTSNLLNLFLVSYCKKTSIPSNK